MKYAFVQQQSASHTVVRLCRTLGVSRSGYYAWRHRKPSARVKADQSLLAAIRLLHQQTRQNYGALKMWKALNAQGIRCGKHRVARLRQQHAIEAKRQRRVISVYHSKHKRWWAPNILQRRFVTTKPDQVWVGDVTFVPTRQGWIYLAVLIDLYSRKVIGWSMADKNDTHLVLSCLQMAIEHRRPQAGLIHHTDQGQTYAANVYRQLATEHGITQSMSRKGNCWDNAVAESFFATLEFELLNLTPFQTKAIARTTIFEYIEVFYNRQRIHQTLDYKTPLEIEESYRCVA